MMLSRCAAAVAVEAALVAFALSGCGGITHGTITSKGYVGPSSYIYEEPVYSERCVEVKSGSIEGESCTSYVSTWIPIQETRPACWKLNLVRGNKSGSVCVSGSAWETVKVGGKW
jgi:hypothetical protein